jgi:carboxylesterase type B
MVLCYQLDKDDDDLLPVIFWIHGGAFYAGDGGIEENGPEFLMDQNIVLVTINYRLGPFGNELLCQHDLINLGYVCRFPKFRRSGNSW